MTKVIIDSSVYTSFYGKDNHTLQTNKFFSRCKELIYTITPTLIIAETITSLTKQGVSNLQPIVQTLLNSEIVNLDSQLIESLLSHLTSFSLKLKTSDLIIALTAKLNKATLITWDKQLLSQNICPVTTPEKFK